MERECVSRREGGRERGERREEREEVERYMGGRGQSTPSSELKRWGYLSRCQSLPPA